MRVLVGVLGGGLLACSNQVDSVSLDFRAEAIGADEVREWSVTETQTKYHRVEVRRIAETGGGCEHLGADLLRTGRDLTIRVRDAGANPNGPLVRCGYTAVIDDLPTGLYTVRVVHSNLVSGSGARVVLHQSLRVR